MSYFIAITKAILIFPLIALLFSIPFILQQFHKYGSINSFRVLIVYSFILYLIIIYFLVILPLPSKEDVLYKPDMIKLTPFGFIKDFQKETSFKIRDFTTYLKALQEPCFYTVIFNIFLTIPFGMYLRYYFQCSLKKTFLISFILSLFLELTQLTGLYFIYPYPYRVFDVDDLIMNTLGGVSGYFLIGIVMKYLPSRREIDEIAIKKGEIVSGLRRLTIFNLDLFLYIFLTAIISFFVRNSYTIYFSFLIYYIIYPYFKEETLGSKFLKVKFKATNFKLLKLIFRIVFIFAYYFGSIFIIMALSLVLANLMPLEFTKISLYLISSLSILIFYLINFFLLLKNKKMFYDNFFQIKYINTIKKEE